MSLDIYVMPLWRFKAGDFQTAVERLFPGKTKIVTPQGVFCRQSINTFLARRRAKQAVRRAVREAERELKTRITWDDNGNTVFAEQASWGFEALRAYARWLDLRRELPSFDDPPDRNFYKHPALNRTADDRDFRFSQLIDHSCYLGYFVPCHFDRVVSVEPFNYFRHFVDYRSFGSSYKLAEQLHELEPHLPSKSDENISEDARELIRVGFDTLKAAAAKSLEHNLPIIFCG